MSMLGAMPSHVLAIARVLLGKGLPVYAVGGCVRGAVMGLPAADYDLCGPASVEEIAAALGEGGPIGYGRVYGRMGTMQLYTKDGYAEYTTFRRDTYNGGHVPSAVRFVTSPGEDATRRDFTCNALYLNLETGALIDPTGGGDDIRRGVLRATTSDPSEIMRDDGLRVLRMVRFAAQLRFAVDPATYACADSKLLFQIARERLQAEASLILLSDHRYALPGGRAALLNAVGQLIELGAADVLFPGCALDAAACARAPADIALRLAALLKDNPLGLARQALAGLRYPNAVLREAELLIEDVQSGTPDAFSLVGRGYPHARRLVKIAPSLMSRLAALEESGAPDSIAALAIDGNEVAKALGEVSPKVGEMLALLWRYAVEHPDRNTRGALLARVDELMKEQRR